MDDINSISQVVLHERQGRDRGWWSQMNDCFWPDSTVALSWFSGSGPDFVSRSAAMSERGDRAVHRLGPPVIDVNGDRALVEISTGVEFRIDWQGIPADLISYTRLNYRLERRDGQWKIHSLNAIYERDTLTAAIPGQTLTFDPQSVTSYRASYALIAASLSLRGYSVRNDLLGDDQPEQVQSFYAEERAWLNA